MAICVATFSCGFSIAIQHLERPLDCLPGSPLQLLKDLYSTDRPPSSRVLRAKRKFDPCIENHASWLKIRNANDSHCQGREELFDHERESDADLSLWNKLREPVRMPCKLRGRMVGDC